MDDTSFHTAADSARKMPKLIQPLPFRPESPKEVHFRSKEGFLLPYMIISVSDEKVLPVRKITVAPKNHVDLARKGMLLYTRSLGYDTEVSLSNLKLRY